MQVKEHYDRLIAAGNDPVLDPPILREYMDKWDGVPFLEALSLTGVEEVLEIGVGSGRLAVRVSPCCAHFTGLDLSEPTLDAARQHLCALDLPAEPTLHCADFLTWTPDRAYDVVYASLTFLHFADKYAAMRQVAACLKPGGRFVLSFEKNGADILDCGDYQLRTYPDNPETIADALAQAGLHATAWTETEFAVLVTAWKE